MKSKLDTDKLVQDAVAAAARVPRLDKRVERAQAGKILRRFGSLARVLGFEHTKPTLFTRRNTHWIEFVHFHKYSGSPSFRSHRGIRVLSDPFPGVGLNGPDHNDERLGDFDGHADSVTAYAERMFAWLEHEAEPWFRAWAQPQRLITDPGSPLDEGAKKALAAQLSGHFDNVAVLQTERLFLKLRRQR